MSEAKCHVCERMYEEEVGREDLYPKKCNYKDCEPKETPIEKPKSIKKKNVKAVQVVDINMSFSSMVSFMVKWTIASIPAMIILFMIGLLFTAVFTFISSNF